MASGAGQKADKVIKTFARQVRRGQVGPASGALRLGVDLGTANIVLAVVDAANRPVTGVLKHDTVVRDGIVVDWAGAVRAVRELRASIEQRLGTKFATASFSTPPGISKPTIKVFSNVLDAAGLDPDEVVDEPVAAARVLGVTDGAVIDIGHGTTGVSVLDGGQVVLSIDEPTGGHHMTLVIAGSRHLEYDAAEKLKNTPARYGEVLGLVRPTLQKMATIARGALAEREVPAVYLVGGASSIDGATEVFEDVLGRPVIRPAEPMFVTPLGVPMSTHPVKPPRKKASS